MTQLCNHMHQWLTQRLVWRLGTGPSDSLGQLKLCVNRRGMEVGAGLEEGMEWKRSEPEVRSKFEVEPPLRNTTSATAMFSQHLMQYVVCVWVHLRLNVFEVLFRGKLIIG